MNIFSTSAPDTIRRSLWERLFLSIENDEVKQIAEQFGKFYLDSIKHGERAFSYDKNSTLPLHDQREAKLNEIIEGKSLSVKDKTKLLDVVGMMHKLYEMAELKAAFNAGEMQKIIDDTLATLGKDLSLEQILEHVQTVRVERILTAHPTFVGKLPYAVLMRDLQNALHAENSEKIDELLGQFNNPDFTAVVDKNLTVADEADFMTHYLSSIAEDRHELYRMFDKAFAKKYGEEYDPTKLELQTYYGDWGTSGDKDGNANVTAKSLEAAMPKRRKAAAERFISILNKFENDEETAQLKAKLGELANLNAEEVVALSAELEKFFEQKSYIVGELQQYALEGLRDVRNLGVSLGCIEFRETAELLEHVIGKFITKADVKMLTKVEGKEYTELSDKQKSKLLNNLLKPKNLSFLQSQIEKTMEEIPQGAKAADYKYKDTGKGQSNNGIFYNTIARLQLAKNNPDMFHTQVLAEAQTPTQFKEMLVLLKALGLEKQIRIVLLFEEPEILLNIGAILEEILSDKDCFDYLVDISLERFKQDPKFYLGDQLEQRIRNLDPTSKDFKQERNAISKAIQEKTGGRYSIKDVLSFEFQLAHSDNTRRGGTTVARGGIGDAHRIGDEISRKYGFTCNIYEGGSQTDSMRKGGKSFRAQINMQGTYNFIKDTVQGIDIFALLNGVASTTAYMGELLCHGLVASKRWNGKEHITPDRRRQADFTNAATPIQKIVNATSALLEYYQNIHFAHSRLAEAMDQIFGYSECKEAGTVGSRAGERVEVESSVKEKSLATDATKVRTIGYSEAGQHAYCHFGFIGAGKLREAILGDLSGLASDLIAKSNTVSKDKELIGLTIEEAFDLAFLTNNGSSNRHNLRKNIAPAKLAEIEGAFDNPVLKSEPELLKSLYDSSPLFRDIVDRNGNSVASSTDFDKVWANAMSKDLHVVGKDGAVISTVRLETRPKPSQLEEFAEAKSTMSGYLAGLEIDYRKASHLVIEAMTGKKFELSDDISTTALKLQVRELMRDKGTLHAGDALHSFADVVKASIPVGQRGDKFDTTHHHLVDFATLHPPTPQPVNALSRQVGIAA